VLARAGAAGAGLYGGRPAAVKPPQRLRFVPLRPAGHVRRERRGCRPPPGRARRRSGTVARARTTGRAAHFTLDPGGASTNQLALEF
jgi:hypothetical protein